MAEKSEPDGASTSTISIQNLICPLCLDIFDDPRILTSCGHTFCRKCLKNYDLSNQDTDHMVCPLCRKITNLSANRVDDLRLNVSISGCVDDYYVKCGGMNAVLEMRPKCTGCKLQQDAVSFCRTCNDYMCDRCLFCHQHLNIYEGHEIISMEDVIEGNVTIGHQFEKCSIHKQENKDMFCDDCKVRVCLRCVVVGHKVHDIKNQTDFEQGLRHKVTELAERCNAKKAELEKNIQNIEIQRYEVHATFQKLLDDVTQAYSIKVEELDENLHNLTEEIKALKQSFDDDLNILKSKDRQRIKSICSSITLVDNDRLGHLETDVLSAHNLLCDELDAMLKEVIDRTSSKAITKKAQEKRFNPADANCLDIGSISESTDNTSAVAITKKAQGSRYEPASASCLDVGNISTSDAKLKVIQYVNLREKMWGMTPYAHDSVAVGYGRYAQGIDIVDSAGGMKKHASMKSDIECWDLVFLQDQSLCVSMGCKRAHMYSPIGSRRAVIKFKSNPDCSALKVNRSPSDEILITNDTKQVYIYDSTGSTLKHTITTKHKTWQASATRSGLIVTSSCQLTNPSVVMVYDTNGNAGESLQAPKDVRLYAAVDEQDSVYVASVDRKNGEVGIRLYDLDGLNLKESVVFSALKNVTFDPSWCYFVSLSPDMLALASGHKLYFIVPDT